MMLTDAEVLTLLLAMAAAVAGAGIIDALADRAVRWWQRRRADRWHPSKGVRHGE